MWLVGWRCLNCGIVLDLVMERNRLGQEMAAGVSTARVSGQNRVGLENMSRSSQASRPNQPGHQPL